MTNCLCLRFCGLEQPLLGLLQTSRSGRHELNPPKTGRLAIGYQFSTPVDKPAAFRDCTLCSGKQALELHEPNPG